MTPDQVRAFQETPHRNHLGKLLRVDGDLGPQTRWALAVEAMPPRRRKTTLRACSTVGLAENPVGSNDEPTGTIARWQKAANAPPRSPWCASGLSEWLELARRYASAQAIGKAFPECEPAAGVIGWYPTGLWEGHCWWVIGYDPLTSTVMDVEANCNNAVRCVRRDARLCRFSDPFAGPRGEPILPAPVIADATVPFLVTRPFSTEGTR
jgi:hypothetical protein